MATVNRISSVPDFCQTFYKFNLKNRINVAQKILPDFKEVYMSADPFTIIYC